jgi:aminoglycoside phosphotransferase (APT) family kinase protein
MPAPKPAADIVIDETLVRALLRAQHPDLADRSLTGIGEGWDNTLFRLGSDLVVRLPRRAASAVLVEHEQRWLPELAPRLPLRIPVPVRAGRAGQGFPWPWSITRWLPGTSVLQAPQDGVATALSLARFLQALHQPAPRDAPHNPWRGVPLAGRTPLLLQHLDRVGALVDRSAVLLAWEHARAAPPPSAPPVWIHGDLHPGNLLIDRGQLAAVIDFGDVCAGDPATDWSVLWMLVAGAELSAMIVRLRRQLNAPDEATVRRARGWALALGVAYLAHSRNDAAMEELARRTVECALQP